MERQRAGNRMPLNCTSFAAMWLLGLKYLNIILPAVLCVAYASKRTRRGPGVFIAFWLGFIALGESIGLWLSVTDAHKAAAQERNALFYGQWFMPLSYLIFFAFYAFVFRGKPERYLAYVLMAVYTGIFFLEPYWFHYTVLDLRYASYNVGSLGVMVLTLTYLRQLMISPAIVQFYRDPLFWFSTGNLLFTVYTFPFFSLMDVWMRYPRLGNIYYVFTLLCTYAQYLCYTFGWVWSRKSYSY